MRAYTVATAAFALDTDPKWIDNLLSHHHIPGVAHSRRGTRRRIPPNSVRIIAIARILAAGLSLPLNRAVELAIHFEAHDRNDIRIADLIVLHLDRDRLHADLARRLDDAAEFAAVPRRGRKPNRDSVQRPESAPGAGVADAPG